MAYQPMEVDDGWVDVKELPIHSSSAIDTGKHHPGSGEKSDLALYQHLSDAASERLSDNQSPVFMVDTDRRQLYTRYLDALPTEVKQQYNCNTCRGFVRRYGGLAIVNDDGSLMPILWSSEMSALMSPAEPGCVALARHFEGAKVLTEFKITSEVKAKMRSAAQSGGFNHMYLEAPDRRVQEVKGLPGFAKASTTELAKMLSRVFEDNSLATVQRVAQIFETDKLPQAHQHIAAARWLLNLMEHDKIKLHGKADETSRHNLLHRYAAEAFVGCVNQLRNGALSTLLEGIEAGKPWEDIEREWKQKTDPLIYLRPQAAPTAGNINASEKLFHQLGIKNSDLRRRYAVFDDIPQDAIMWQSQQLAKDTKPSTLRLFAHISPKPPQPASPSASDLPPTRITFTNFILKILPTAKRIQYKLSTHNPLYFFITGLPDTVPLMQWHHANTTNRASWYIYHKPKAVNYHNLYANAWNDVNALIPFPHLWDGVPLTTTFPLPDANEYENSKKSKFYHAKHGFQYLLLLNDIIDYSNKGLCLFPTLLKSEFHGARATIEKFSQMTAKEFVDDYKERGGYVGGIGIERDLGKRAEGRVRNGDVHLFRVTDQRGAVGVWSVDMFE